MKTKNTICVWCSKDAHEAARFYASTLPNSDVHALDHAPADYLEGEILTSLVYAARASPTYGNDPAEPSPILAAGVETVVPRSTYQQSVPVTIGTISG